MALRVIYKVQQWPLVQRKVVDPICSYEVIVRILRLATFR
jgi:hypothetical protein